MTEVPDDTVELPDRSIDLQALFLDRQSELAVHLGRARSIPHPTAAGDEGEEGWRDVLREFLPDRYEVSLRRFVIDSNGNVSEQQDIVIHDSVYAPTFLVIGSTHFIPVESVYAVVEVKTTLSKAHVTYAGEKVESVRSLQMVPGEFGVLGEGREGRGAHRPHEILGGIVCHESDWSPAFGVPFHRVLEELTDKQRLDVGCVATGGAFSSLSDSVATASSENALIAFCVALFDALQKVGNATAVDAIRYASELWSTDG